MRLALGCLLLALPALAQLDSSAMRAKFGPPLNRETFHVRAGLDIAVDYGANQQVCAIEIPVLPTQNDTEAFLGELIPASVRGKELSRMMSQMGLAWASFVEYEHVTIVESGHGDTRNPTTVQFKTEGCR
jgi:hypothetical protein